MGIDETVNLERLASAFERIAKALEERNTIERDWIVKSFPPEKPKRAAEVIHPDQDKRNEFSDKADADWFNKTEAALPKTRFQERLEKANPARVSEKRRRVVEVPKKQ